MTEDELNELLGDELDDTPVSLQRKTRTGTAPENSSKQSDNDSGDNSNKKSHLGLIIGLATTAVIAIILVCVVLFVVLSGGKSAKDDTDVQEATSVQGQSSVLDNLESLKDSQIAALNDKIKTIESANSKNASTLEQGYAAITAQTAADTANIETVLEKFYAIENESDDAAVNVIREDIAKYMTDAAGSTVAYDLVSGATPAKMLAQNGRKSSASTIMQLASGKNFAVYLAISPFTTDQGTTHAVSLATVAGNPSSGDAAKGRPLSNIEFIGVMTDADVGLFEKALERSLDSASKLETDSASADATSTDTDKNNAK